MNPLADQKTNSVKVCGRVAADIAGDTGDVGLYGSIYRLR
jgi:hypothetical protein